jgi:hypothetical protein
MQYNTTSLAVNHHHVEVVHIPAAVDRAAGV